MLQLCLQPYKTNIVYKPEQTRVPPATELQEVNNATAAEETLQGLSSKIDSNSKVAQGWKKCQPLSWYQQVKQELSVSNGVILRGTCIIVPEKATRSNDYASSQWSTGDCQDEAFSAQFSLVSRIERMVEKVVKGFLLCQAANHDLKPVYVNHYTYPPPYH